MIEPEKNNAVMKQHINAALEIIPQGEALYSLNAQGGDDGIHFGTIRVEVVTVRYTPTQRITSSYILLKGKDWELRKTSEEYTNYIGTIFGV